ncbi:ATP-binding protein [uncultured Roseovarius sp.]|uniref:ATP-binding protein n=1 Tax=uncultured Roseovarius sp. TaxID=293344 RepID=UPI00260B5191|nr:ATP-binding protein [uncultured Roseovarius sp.]
MIPDTTPDQFSHRIMATELAVRDALLFTRDWLNRQGLPEQTCGSVELALAEVLNNIVEHAYAPDAAGEIRIAIALRPGRLCCLVRDDGAPLPYLAATDHTLPSRNVTRDNLPEGGFGWFLIKGLTDRLGYERANGENRLTLEFRLDIT